MSAVTTTAVDVERPAPVAALEAAVLATARELTAHVRRAGDLPTGMRLEGVLLGQRAAVFALAAMRYAVAPTPSYGRVQMCNVTDEWAEVLVDAGLTEREGAELARRMNRGCAAALDADLGRRAARAGHGGGWLPLPLHVTLPLP